MEEKQNKKKIEKKILKLPYQESNQGLRCTLG